MISVILAGLAFTGAVYVLVRLLEIPKRKK
jgi:hypothetical protein